MNELEQQTKDNKIVFKCKHCDNDDIRYMQFASLNRQSPQYANHVYRQNWDYETTPKVPIGVHIRCAKCGKDTFIIPNVYNGTMWGIDIPQQCITNITYEQPKFSAKKYIINSEGCLDVVVTTINNEIISVLSQCVVQDKDMTEISKERFEILLTKGLPTVQSDLLLNKGANKNESTNATTNDIRTRESNTNVTTMATNDTRTKTTGNAKSE